MKIKTKILYFAVAAILAAVSILPVGIFAEHVDFTAERDYAAARQIMPNVERRGQENRTSNESAEIEAAAAAGSDRSAETAAYYNYSSINITADSAETLRGRSVTFTSDQFEYYDNGWWFRELSGALKFKSGSYSKTVNYFNIGIDSLYDYDTSELRLLIPWEIPAGEYDVTVDLVAMGDGGCIKGTFRLKISENPNRLPELREAYGEDKIEVDYEEYVPVLSDDALSFIAASMNYDIYIIGSVYINYGCGILPGSGSVSGLVEKYDETGSFYESTTSLPLTLKAPKQVSVPQSGAVELPDEYNNQVSLKEPVPGDTFNKSVIKYVSKTTGYAVAFPELYDDLVFDENGNITGFDFNSFYASPYKSDEYEYYILDCDSMTEYGPINIKYYDFTISTYISAAKPDTLTVYYDFYVNLNEIEYIDTSMTDDSGKLCLEQISAPEQYYGDQFNFDLRLPDGFEMGEYFIETEIHYMDGATETLPSKHIAVDDRGSAVVLESDHNYITPSTKRISLIAEFETFSEKNNDYVVVLMDRYGRECGRSENCYYMRSNPAKVIYDVIVNEDLTQGNYYPQDRFSLELVSPGGKLSGSYTHYYVSFDDVPVVSDSKAVDAFNVEVMIENIDRGEYPVYAYQNGSENEPIGKLTVRDDGSAALKFNEPYVYGSARGTVYIYYNNEYVLLENIDMYRDYPNARNQVNWCGSNISSLSNAVIALSGKTVFKREDILGVKLSSGGNVIAEGENIKLIDDPYYSGGYGGTIGSSLGIKRDYRDIILDTYINVDFPAIDSSKITDSTADITVITKNGDIDAGAVSFVNNNEFNDSLYSYIDLTNYYYQYDGNYAQYDNIDFIINGTNYTEGEVALCEYNADTQERSEPLAAIQLSELERVENNGLYGYRGSFKNVAQPGKTYMICYRNQKEEDAGIEPDYIISPSPVIYATDQPRVWFYENSYNLSSSVLEMYCTSVNISGGDKLTAVFQNENGKFDIPVRTETIEYIDEYTGMTDRAARFTFDFSGVAKPEGTGVVTVYLNGEKAGLFGVYDMRGSAFAEHAYIGAKDNKPALTVDGGNLEAGSFELKLWDLGEHNLTEVRGENLLRDVILSPDINNINELGYYEIPIEFPGLTDGRYMIELYFGGRSVPLDRNNITLRAESEEQSAPVVVTRSAADGTNMNVDLLNISENEIRASVLIGAYDRNGALIDISDEIPVTIPANGELKNTSISISPNAARYKVFVWDSLENMKPLAK